jgi:hypothetical protein
MHYPGCAQKATDSLEHTMDAKKLIVATAESSNDTQRWTAAPACATLLHWLVFNVSFNSAAAAVVCRFAGPRQARLGAVISVAGPAALCSTSKRLQAGSSGGGRTYGRGQGSHATQVRERQQTVWPRRSPLVGKQGWARTWAAVRLSAAFHIVQRRTLRAGAEP